MKRLNSLFKSRKFLDIFCYVFCALYLVFVIAYAFNDIQIQKDNERQLNNLVNSAVLVNKNLLDKKFYSPKKEETKTLPTEPLFNNGETAILQAFKKLDKANSFIVVMDGTADIGKNIAGLGNFNLKLAMKNTSIKYNENKVYNENAVKKIGGSYPAVFESPIEQWVAYCSKSLRINETIADYTAVGPVKLVNGEPVGDFKGIRKQDNVNKSLLADNMVIVNKETIEKIGFFKVKYKNDIPQYYYIQADLDAVKSAKKLRKIMNIDLGPFKFNPPTYLTTKLTACLNAYGDLLSFRLISNVKEYLTTPLGSFEANCYLNVNFVITAIDKEINFVPEGF